MSQYDYSPDTLRGALAAVVLARAEEVVREIQAEEAPSPDGYTAVTLEDVQTVMDNDYRNYDRMLEVMDHYFDDWANSVAEQLGYVR